MPTLCLQHKVIRRFPNKMSSIGQDEFSRKIQNKRIYPKNFKCEICKGPANDYQHFGCRKNCCYSCKAFFRRVIRCKRVLKCKKDKKCEISFQDRTKCSYCRHQKCLESGMDPDWVMNNKDLQERQQLIEVRNSLSLSELSDPEQIRSDYENRMRKRRIKTESDFVEKIQTIEMKKASEKIGKFFYQKNQ